MKQLIVFIDSGDTLINEDTEVRDARDVVLRAEMLPGAKEMLLQLKASGYPVALVADGLAESFENVYGQHGVRELFDGWAVSELVGVCKPDPRMFQTAMAQLSLTDADIPRIVMIGNNIKRDIRGANALGITSILMQWSRHYSYTPDDPLEIPRYAVTCPAELPSLLKKLRGG